MRGPSKRAAVSPAALRAELKHLLTVERPKVTAEVALRHANIVALYGVEIADGQPLLAMEWIDGRPLAQRVFGEHALEQAVVSDLIEDALAQLFATTLIAPHHTQVEIDAGAQQVLRCCLADKRRKPPRPFGTRQAQLRVAGHDVARAQREAELGQRLPVATRRREGAGADAARGAR